MSPAKQFWIWSLVVLTGIAIIGLIWTPGFWLYAFVSPFFLLGVQDYYQTRQNIRRNFPLIGNLRYLFESVRPEIQQYFVESDISGRPYSRELRSVVYQRAKATLDTRPFGTIRDLYETGNEWLAHSLAPCRAPEEEIRIPIGEGRCEKPYHSSILNVSAMSFGSLSRHAILALNGGAKLGGFSHNTGEGGLSPYHLEPGGDLVWQIGTGYFGCRNEKGGFHEGDFEKKAAIDVVKMIEIKLSQGAKPGHGGILPGSKVTPEIAEIRGVPLGKDVISPPQHSAFSTPKELMDFIARLRKLSGGKPIGIKLCVGRTREFMALCKAMIETGEVPDFITVDGAEGGTGAAPMEFSNSLGLPLTEGLLVVHNCLVGCGLRKKIKIIASGKITTGFNIIQRVAIAADLCNSARTMMFALGCIQALRCNANDCPVGVATQDRALERGLDIEDKVTRVYNFHRLTVESAMEILGAAGFSHPDQLSPRLIHCRVSRHNIRTYQDLYDYYKEGALLSGEAGEHKGAYGDRFARNWEIASADTFACNEN